MAWQRFRIAYKTDDCLDWGRRPGNPGIAGYVALMARSWLAMRAASVPPWFLPAVGAAYVALALAAVVLNQLELRLQLVHYRVRSQVHLNLHSCSSF